MKGLNEKEDTELLKSKIDTQNIPEHVAIIMDGNGRWAKEKGYPRVYGHKNGVESVRACSEAAAEIGVKYLTLYAFSTENWNRPKAEVDTLMGLLVDTVNAELETLNKNNISLEAIGDLENLPEKTQDALRKGIKDTSSNTRMKLVLALNYSARWDIMQASRSMAAAAIEGKLNPDEIDESTIDSFLVTRDFPDPELMIRTSGEQRMSNFLLWELAYAELYFTSLFWPEFRKKNFYEAILNYQNRERRFGKISEQLKQA